MQAISASRRRIRWGAALLVGVIATAGLINLESSPAQANDLGDSLYTRASENEFLAYPRIIRLEHGGASNGTLLASFEHANADGTPTEFIIKKSLDDGETWTTTGTLSDPLTGVDHPSDQMWQPFFYEFPTEMGGFPAGTLVLVGNVAPSTKVRTDFVLWRSTDHGATWTYESVLQTGGGSVGAVHGGSGIWEPFLTMDDQGRLAMYFSDERLEPEYAQVLAHMVSNDGGVTWSANADGTENFAPGLVIDVQSDTPTDRPGMPTLATLPNGDMVMAYEICGAPRNCEAHTKTSTDGGTTWGNGPSDLGTKAVTTDGRYLGSSPYIVWSPVGGPDGQLLLTGMRTRYISNNAFTPEDRQAIFVNNTNGAGPWSWTPAPFQPLSGADHCSASYSPHLLLSQDGASVRFSAATTVGTNGCMEGTAVGTVGQLPYTSDFTHGQSGWTTYGGCWTTASGILSESCGGATGNKAIAGSTGWADYTLVGDVRIDSGPQAGFLVRATNPRVGGDAVNGYYVGVNGTSVMIGKLDGTWTKAASTPIPGGLATGSWYRLTVQAIGCSINVTGIPAGTTGTPVAISYTDPDCSFAQGAIGVRAQTGTASWRDITVSNADSHVELVLSPAEVPFGTSTELSAKGLPADATGTLIFSDSNSTLCTATLPTTACHTDTQLAAGSYAVAVAYSGNDQYGSSTSAELTLTVSKAAVALAVSADASTIVHGESTALSASGLPANATGSVQFLAVNDALLCTATLPDVSCATPAELAGGSHEVRANYVGDANHQPATSTAVPLTVTPEPTALTVRGSSVGGTTTLIVSGLPDAATGTVIIRKSAGTELCTITRPNDSCPVPSLAEGTYPITAAYSGDASFAMATATTTITVTGASGVTDPDSPTDGNGDDDLAATGGEIGFAGLAALLLLLVGGFFIHRRRASIG